MGLGGRRVKIVDGAVIVKYCGHCMLLLYVFPKATVCN